ncbi:hypothetical protein NHX12_017970, partial [Muraenolepis orangiensis]
SAPQSPDEDYDDWQEEHQRLAGLDVHDVGGGVAGGGATDIGGVGLEDGRRGQGGDLAESLARLILGADPAIAGLGAAQSPSHSLPGPPGSALSRVLPPPSLRPHLHHPPHQLPGGPSSSSGLHPSMMSYQQQQQLLCRGSVPMGQMASPSIWENSMGFGPVSHSLGLITHMEDSPLMSIIKEVGLPKQPPPLGCEEPRDLSERVPPPRSSSPVIGSPPVRAVPIGTPPKQPISLNHQIHHPTAVRVRAPLQHRYPPPFPDRLSPNTLLNIANNPLCRGPFPPGVGPILSHLLNSQVAGFPRGAPPMLPGSGGFRPFFGGPPPPHGHMMPPPPIHGPRVGIDRRSRDPYSNLMTQREKEWVAKIQMMQLQSTDPYLDDYYYQNYYEKLEKRQQRERDSSIKKEHTTRLITPQVAKVEHTYRPVQFAGSLGKLTVSSVNNPRKMIDAVATSRSDDEEKREKQVWNKRRQILYTVEKMYSCLLEVQDFEKRLIHAADEERGALLDRHRINMETLCNLLTDTEQADRVSDEQCVTIMSVRKGKRLISRLLPFLPPQLAAAVVMAIARNLPALAKKDKQDQVLCWLVEPVAMVIQSLSSSALTDLLQEIEGREGQLTSLMDDNRWTELVFSAARELLAIPPSSLAPPLFTPPNLLGLFARYVDRQSLEQLQLKLQ